MNEVITTADLKQRQTRLKELGFNIVGNAHQTLSNLNNTIYCRQNELEELILTRDNLVKGINNYLA